jgi:hypothetical protein
MGWFLLHSKPNSHGRTRFESLFMEELMSGEPDDGEIAETERPSKAKRTANHLQAK